MSEAKEYEWAEVFDGVLLIHKGFTYNHCIPDEDRPTEIIDMYDLSGNKFYGNYENIEKAEEELERMAQKGVELIIGHKAPCRDAQGKAIPNNSKHGVALYQVSKYENQKVKKLLKDY